MDAAEVASRGIMPLVDEAVQALRLSEGDYRVVANAVTVNYAIDITARMVVATKAFQPRSGDSR